MNKIIKYGVVAGLTMAAFSVAGAPVYADEPAPEPVCTVEAAATEYLYTVSNCASDLELYEKISGTWTLVPATNYVSTVSDGNGTLDLTDFVDGLDVGTHEFSIRENLITTKAEFEVTIKSEVTAGTGYVYNVSRAENVEALVWNEQSSSWSFIDTNLYIVSVDAKGDGTVDMTKYFEGLEAGVYKIKFMNNWKDVSKEFEVTIIDKVELESVTAEIDGDDKIATTYNEGYEGAPALGYAVEDGYKDIVTVAADGTISVADTYKTATAKDVTITVTATDGEIVKTTTVTYTIAANYTAVEASFENDKDTIKVSGETKIITEEVDGVKYTFNYDDTLIAVTSDGIVTVKKDLENLSEREVSIVVNGIVGEGEDAVELTPKELILTIEANVFYEYEEEGHYKVTEGDGQVVIAGSGPVTFKIDAPYDKVKYIQIQNMTLADKDWDDMTDAEKAAVYFCYGDAFCADEIELVKGRDFTIDEGSTVLTLTESFLAKLMPGEHAIWIDYRDDTNPEKIVYSNAKTTFTVAAAPDTGVATAVKVGATSSVLASVLAAITAAGAAVVAKFAKRK